MFSQTQNTKNPDICQISAYSELYFKLNYSLSDSYPFKGKPNYHSEIQKIWQVPLLSGREVEFLKAFESGLELKFISEKMNINYKTADTHRINILNRLGARNPMAAIDLAKRIGLI